MGRPDGSLSRGTDAFLFEIISDLPALNHNVIVAAPRHLPSPVGGAFGDAAFYVLGRLGGGKHLAAMRTLWRGPGDETRPTGTRLQMALQIGSNDFVGGKFHQLEGKAAVRNIQNGGRAAAFAIGVAAIGDAAVKQRELEHLVAFFARTHTVDE